jgi:tetratricopeptide (TPR) repeat protein
LQKDEGIVHTYIDPGYRFHRRNHHLASFFALHLVLVTGTLGVTVLPAEPARAAAKHTDKREIEARQAFASGQYQQALDLYAALYADKVHPTYLRNIGRCYQNLRQPEKAINAFRDYLRQAKDLTAAERSEVEGYIKEMEELQKQQAAAASAAAAPPPAAPPTVPAAPPVGPDRSAAQESVLVTNRVPAEPPPPTPFYKKAWFWAVVGVAVAGGVVGGLYAGGVFSKSTIPCTAANGCYTK